jgi:hypothetical protein
MSTVAITALGSLPMVTVKCRSSGGLRVRNET